MGIAIFLLASLFYFYEYALQVSPSVMSTALMRDFSINATAFGAMAGAFYFTYTAMQVPGGMLLDHFGARVILSTIVLLCALGAVIFSFAPNVSVATLARLMMGVGGAFGFTSVLYLLIRWFPPFYFAMFVGFTQTMGCIGGMFGQGPLARLEDAFGWHYAILIVGCMGLVLALLFWTIIRDHPAKTVAIKIKKDPANIWKNLLEVLAKPQTWPIAIYAAGIWSPVVGFTALWAIPFFKLSEHLSTVQASSALCFAWIGIAVGSPLVGWFSDVIHRRCLPLTLCALLGCGVVITIIFAQNLPLYVLEGLLFLLGVSAGGQTLIFGVVKDITPHRMSGTATGFNNMAVVSGGAFLQPLIGKALDHYWMGGMMDHVRVYSLHGYHVALGIIPILLIIAAVMSHFLIRETYCHETYLATEGTTEGAGLSV
jgi:MFS family permease